MDTSQFKVPSSVPPRRPSIDVSPLADAPTASLQTASAAPSSGQDSRGGKFDKRQTLFGGAAKDEEDDDDEDDDDVSGDGAGDSIWSAGKSAGSSSGEVMANDSVYETPDDKRRSKVRIRVIVIFSRFCGDNFLYCRVRYCCLCS